MYSNLFSLICLELLLQTLSILASPLSDASASLPPLYNQDPHDVQSPTYPLPTCATSQGPAFDIAATIGTTGAIVDFCTTQTGIISATSQEPISAYYPGGQGKMIRFTLSWDNTGTCPTNGTTHSPSDNSGRGCETIFRDIVLSCKSP